MCTRNNNNNNNIKSVIHKNFTNFKKKKKKKNNLLNIKLSANFAILLIKTNSFGQRKSLFQQQQKQPQ